MSLALLWAVLLHSTASYAHDSTQVAQVNSTAFYQAGSGNSDDSKTGLQPGKLYLAQEGTNNTLKISLQPATMVAKTRLIWFTSHKATPTYSSRAPGDSFFCQFYYTSSQPQAP